METGPIRPPSEAQSLLILVDRNCAWNRCAFCPVYKGASHAARPAAEILAEVEGAAKAAGALLAAAGRQAPPLTRAEALAALRSGPGGELEQRVAAWLMRGGRGLFLQDADPLRAPLPLLLALLEALRRSFPWVATITAYARTSTLLKLEPDGLGALAAAGLTRVHAGVESGDDPVLRMQRKGATFQVHSRGLRAARESGLEVCAYLMPGLGGRERSQAHAEASARLVAEALPHVVRLRSLCVLPGTPLDEERAAGRFTPLDEEQTAAEILLLLRRMGPLPVVLHSDHGLNLFPELEGRLDRDLEAMTGLLERFLALPRGEREALIRARRRRLPTLL